MRESERIVRYTRDEVEERIARGEDRTDWARVDALSEAELGAAIAVDPDSDTGAIDPRRGLAEIPRPKEELRLKVDAGVLEWFKVRGLNRPPSDQRGPARLCRAAARAHLNRAAVGMSGEAHRDWGMTVRHYHAIVEGDADSGYSVFFPDLPGCTSGGGTLQEAALNAEEALAGHLALMLEAGEEVPPPGLLDGLAVEPDVVEAASLLVRVSLREALPA
jgi:predicted RNase H-like HicB family nuclease/uncharacterized protein (DUF4415 family)